MAPNGQKRKRQDPIYPEDSSDGPNRPSPHRPQNLGHAQQNLHYNPNARGERRSSRQLRGGGTQPTTPVPASPNVQPTSQQAPPTNLSNPMSPPSAPTIAARANSNVKTETSVPSKNEPISASPAAAPPKPNPFPYNYQYLTEDRRKAWTSSGRASTVQEACQARDSQDTMTLSTVFQELVRAGLDGPLDPTEAGKAIQEIVGDTADESNTTATLFLDCVTIMTEDDVGQQKLPTLIFATGVSPNLMRMKLETPLLVALGLVRPIFPSQQIRAQTAVHYKLGNYNLLREESEGYAKLMTEYFTTVFSASPTAELVHDTFTKVLGMIGAFDLDVGRVLDVTLDVFANLLVRHYRFFIKFLVASSWWPNNKSFEGIETPDYPWKNLPPWALPDSTSYSITKADKERLVGEREERDVKFWDRVREIGMGAYFELGGREIVIDEESASQLQVKIDQEKKEFEKKQKQAAEEAAAKGRKAAIKEFPRNSSREWVAATRTIPPRGNFEAAQLLGFKLRFYSSEARDPEDTFPENLIYLAALLIKIGFISLKDLYPHLYPADSEMETIKAKKLQEKTERTQGKAGGVENALTKAAPLVDDEPAPSTTSRPRDKESRSTEKPTETSEDTKKPELPEPADQKVLLLKSLLAIGAIPEALYILGRFPWLVDVYPDVLKYIHRILQHCISNLYDQVRPFPDRESVRGPQEIVMEQTGASSTNDLATTELPKRRVVRWAQLDKVDSGEMEYRYYWEHWTDDVPVCQTIDDLFTLCSTLLNFSGVKIGQDTTLLLKLVRIATKSLIEDTSPNNSARWTDLTKRLLLPSLSFVKVNPAVVSEVWNLLGNFTVATRFNMYAELYTGATSRNPDMQEAFGETKLQATRVMKRISSENLPLMARSLAKAAYASPGIVFQVAFSQVESYEWLITGFVECGRYFTDLAYDVLTWSLLNAMGSGTRSRVQLDGMLTSSWLKSLSLLSGQVFKTYSKMDVTPLLQFIGYQLQRGCSIELEVLEQIVWYMAGIATDVTFSEKETQAMAGSPTLRAQTLITLGDQRHDKYRQDSSQRLIKSLKTCGLVGQLLIALVQERQSYPYRKSSSNIPLKAIGNNIDKIHLVYGQYLDMLRAFLTTAEFNEAIPGVASLISDFGLEPSFAFEISRPSLVAKIMEADTATKLERQQEKARRDSAEQTKLNGDVEMGDDASKIGPSTGLVVAESSTSKAESSVKEEGEEGGDDILMNDAPQSIEQSLAFDAGLVITETEEPWHPVLKPLIQDLRPVVRSDFESTSSLAFFVTFWQLGAHDLIVPTQSYQEEIHRLQTKVTAVKADRSDISTKGVKEKEAKIKHLTDLSDQLREEMKSHVEYYQQIRNRLNREKDRWFAGLGNTRESVNSLNMALLQDCFIPRMLLSPLDAQYAYKMIFYLHSSGTPGFRTMFLLDNIFLDKLLTALIFKCTAVEAENLGRFLHELLKELGKWHASKSYYEKQAFGAKKDLPGFATGVVVEKGSEAFKDYEEFRTALFKWHRNLNNALKACFVSGEYMHIKNAIIVLKAIHVEFPAVTFMGKNQVEVVSALANDSRRSDLKVAASSLLRSLKNREKDWVMPQAFHINPTANSGQRSSSQAPPAKPGTPQPGTSRQDTGTTKQLETSAPDSRPRPSSLVHEASYKTPTPGRGDAEDGEIEDEKSAKTVSRADEGTNVESSEKELEPEKMDLEPANEENLTPKPNTPKPSTPVPSTEPRQKTNLREEGLQQKESQKASSPALPSTNAPSRQPATSNASTRTPHQLPSRPEQLPRRGNERGPERARDPQARRDGRSTQREDYGRLDRPTDLSRSDVNGDDARPEQSPSRRGRGRTPERSAYPGYERSEHMSSSTRDRPAEHGPRPMPRDTRASGTRTGGRVPSGYDVSRERPSDHSREFQPPLEKRTRISPPPSMGPPESIPSQQSDNRSLAHPDRAAHIQQPQPPSRPSSNPRAADAPRMADDRMSMNPERAALISGELHQDSRPRDSPRDRPPRHGEKDRRSSYEVDDYHHGRQDFDGHHHGVPSGSRDRRDEVGPPPSGPRGSRRSERELFEGGVPPRSSSDQNTSRLAQDYPQPRPAQDPNYGRLNAQADVPSGPRGRGTPGSGRGGRNFTAPQPSINTRIANNEAGMPSPAAQTPTRSYRDRMPSQFERPPPTTPHSTTQTPTTDHTAASDLSSVHPSRLGRVQPSPIRTETPSYPNPPQQSPASASGMHPPSGPRMQHASSAQSYPPTEGPNGGRNVPTGPSSGPTNERQRNEARKFAGMQDVLSQAGTPSTQGPPAERGGNNVGLDPGPGPAAMSDRGGNVSIRGQATSGRRLGPPQGPQGSGASSQISSTPSSTTLRSGSGSGAGAISDGLPPRPPPSDMRGQGHRNELFPARAPDERDNRRPSAENGGRRDERAMPPERGASAHERPGQRSTLPREPNHHERHGERETRAAPQRVDENRDNRDRDWERKNEQHRPPPFERMPSDRDLRSANSGVRRGRDDGREQQRPGPPGGGPVAGMARPMDAGRRPMMGEMEHGGYGGGGGGGNGGWGGHPDARNGDARMRGPPGHMGPPAGADGRRDERDRGGRDTRKRRGDEGMHGDNKRSRRSG